MTAIHQLYHSRRRDCGVKSAVDRTNMIGITQHLTKDPLKARAARQNYGKPGRRKGEPWTPRRRD
jgi:hypothetical protein